MSILLLSAAITAQTTPPSPGPPPPPPPPPPMFFATAPSETPPVPAIVDYALTEVRCRGEVERVVSAVRPLPGSTFQRVGQATPHYQIAFRIDAEGRPLGIGQPGRVGTDASYVYGLETDLAPALAVTRFAPGVERQGCVATFTPTTTPVASAPDALLHRYAALPGIMGPARMQVMKRLRDASPGCFTPTPPRPLLQGYPDFDAIPQSPGTLAYTMVGYDIDAKGVPVRVRTLSSDGNEALDRAAVAAIAKSRFTAGARTGCTYPYHRRQTVAIAPPPAPEREAFAKAGATCDNAVPWAKLPPLSFPEAFRRRSIEGWATFRYDVAPWGGTGNIEVLASEPAAAFGEAGKRVIAGAMRPPSETGATGCIDRVRFKMGEPGTPANTADIPPPPPF